MKKLESCYVNALKLASENSCKTIAFPSISTGIYKFPKDKAAKIAIHTIKAFLDTNAELVSVVLVSFDEENYKILINELEAMNNE